MNPKSVVTCLPSKDLEKSLVFYRDCFGLPDLAIDEEMIVIELGNLSLFVMSEESFKEYADTIGLSVSYPNSGLQVIHSCAIEDHDALDRAFAAAEDSGGSVAKPVHTNRWDQEIGYLRDPDGHVWELVKIGQSA